MSLRWISRNLLNIHLAGHRIVHLVRSRSDAAKRDSREIIVRIRASRERHGDGITILMNELKTLTQSHVARHVVPRSDPRS